MQREGGREGERDREGGGREGDRQRERGGGEREKERQRQTDRQRQIQRQGQSVDVTCFGWVADSSSAIKADLSLYVVCLLHHSYVWISDNAVTTKPHLQGMESY